MGYTQTTDNKYRRKGFWRKPINQFWKDNDYYRDSQDYFEKDFLPTTSEFQELKSVGSTGSGSHHQPFGNESNNN